MRKIYSRCYCGESHFEWLGTTPGLKNDVWLEFPAYLSFSGDLILTSDIWRKLSSTTPTLALKKWRGDFNISWSPSLNRVKSSCRENYVRLAELICRDLFQKPQTRHKTDTVFKTSNVISGDFQQIDFPLLPATSSTGNGIRWCIFRIRPVIES